MQRLKHHAYSSIDPSVYATPFAVTPLLAPWLAVAQSAGTLAGVNAADIAVGGPAARADNGVAGAGVKIGILSDSFNVRGGAAADVAAGLLPANGATILEEGPAGSTDEGRAIAEILHQTAPGAQLYFYTAFNSAQDYANGIAALHAAGCQIIVDDVTYPNEPMFQIAGPIDAAVQQAVATGADYFNSAHKISSRFSRIHIRDWHVAAIR